MCDTHALTPTPPFTPSVLLEQYAWLEADLAAVDRTRTPFIVSYGHRHLYCSNTDDLPDCSTDAQRLRDGFILADVVYPGLDTLLARYNVSIVFVAHEHSYERTWPVYNQTVDASQKNPGTYTNPHYPVHIVSGAAGCPEDLDYFDELHHGPWSLVRSSSYGYGHLRIVNATHLHWLQYLSEGTNGTDQLWFVQTQAPSRSVGAAAGVAPTWCDGYCLAVCLHDRQAHTEAQCAKDCRCQAELERGALQGVRAAANVAVRRGLIHHR